MFHISASNLINSIDPKADPCNDFYQFACGKWRKKHVIPEYASITGVTHKLNDELDIILKREITWYDLISIAKYTMSFIQIIIYYIFHACVKCRFLLFHKLDKKGTALFFPILTFLISFELLSNSLYFWYVASLILFFQNIQMDRCTGEKDRRQWHWSRKERQEVLPVLCGRRYEKKTQESPDPQLELG